MWRTGVVGLAGGLRGGRGQVLVSRCTALDRRVPARATLALAWRGARSASFDAGPVRVLVGTQTGTAMSFAESLRDTAEARSAALAPVDVRDLGDYDAAVAFEHEKQVVLVLACYGVGEPTDNARSFVRWLQDPARTPLPHLKYAVFGLGSSKTHKSNYNVVAKSVDARLQALGATRCFPLGLGDDSGWYGRFYTARGGIAALAAVGQTLTVRRAGAARRCG